MKAELQRIINHIEAGDYKAAREALEAIPEDYALPEVDTFVLPQMDMEKLSF